MAAGQQSGEANHQDSRKAVADDHDAPTVPAVHQRAGKRGDADGWNCRGNESKREFRG